MTTIGNFAVDLTLNASGLFRNATLARGEFAMLGGAANRLRTDFEKESFILQRMEHGVASLSEKTEVHNEVLRRQRALVESLRPKTEEQINQIKREQEERARLTQQEKDAAKNRESLMTPQERHAGRRAELYEQFRRNLLLRSQYDALVKLSAAERDKELVDKKAVANQEKLNSVISKHRTELQRLKADLALLVSAQRNVIGSDEQLASAINNVNNKIKEEEDRLSKLNNKTSETSGIVSGLTNRFVGFMAAKFTVSSISNLITQADQANIELSRTEAILGAISGSKFAGNQLIADLRQLTRQMPITLKDAAEGAKNLIAYGMSSREVIPVIRALGAITGGNTERFKNLANAVAQMRGANRLMGQEVIQAVNAGWNPLAEISRNTGKSILVLKKEMEEGKLGFDLVTQALQTATTGMGRFANVANDVMNTVAGKQQMLTARWEEGMARMGKAIEPASIAFKSFAADAIEKIGLLSEKFGGFFELLTNGFSKKPGTYSLSDFLFGPESALGVAGQLSDISQFDMLGGYEGDKFGQKNGQANRQIAIKEMSENIRLMEIVGRLKSHWATQEQLSVVHIQAYNMYLKRQTEEKEKQKRIADAQAEKEKKQQQVSLEQIKAKEMADQKFESMYNRMQLELEQLKKGQVAADTLKAQMAGMNTEQIKKIELVSKEIAIAKEKNDLEEKAAKDQIRYKDLIAKYQKKSESAAETAAREIRDIDKALAMKQLSLMEARDIKQKIIAGVVKSEGGDKMPIGAGPPKAMLRGSAEAVNAVLSKMREPVAIQMKQLEEMKQLKAATKEVEKAIKNQDKVEAKR